MQPSPAHAASRGAPATAEAPADGSHLFQIKSRFDGRVLFELRCGSLRLCVQAAVQARADLADADLAGANLARANLADADLADADLADADLADADLARANLAGANLARADLAGADLAGANLADANLAGANLADANLADANLADADLADAKWRDGIAIQRRPLQLHGLDYPVTVLDQHMQIGCELHLISEWAAFDNERIARMDGVRARRFWAAHRDALLMLARSDKRGVAQGAVETEEAV